MVRLKNYFATAPHDFSIRYAPFIHLLLPVVFLKAEEFVQLFPKLQKKAWEIHPLYFNDDRLIPPSHLESLESLMCFIEDKNSASIGSQSLIPHD